MPNEENNQGADRYAFTAQEIAAILSRESLQADPDSPFYGILPEANPETATDVSFAAAEAVKRVAQPSSRLRFVFCTPPEPALIAEYYSAGTSSDYVLHERHGEETHRIAYPVEAMSLIGTGELALRLNDLAETTGFTMEFDRNAFQALVGIVDLIQERTLRAMLERRLPPDEIEFSAHDVGVCCARNIEPLDTRWMVARAIVVSPLPLRFSPQEIERGLAWMRDTDVLQESDGMFELKAAFGLVCSRLIGCSGFCAVSTQRSQDGGTGNASWLHDHFAGLRCHDGLWQLEFFDITEDDFKVTLLDVSPQMLYGRLRASIFPHEPLEEQGEVPGEETKDFETVRCSECGSEYPRNAPFCMACGAGTESDKVPTRDQIQEDSALCHNCGASVSLQDKFCSVCGNNMISVPPPKPQSFCRHCGKLLRPGVKFCTGCGTAIQ